MSAGYFVAGSDTGVGKTLVSAALIRLLVASGRRVAGMKPVAAGSIASDGHHIWEDSEALVAQSNVSATLHRRVILRRTGRTEPAGVKVVVAFVDS